MKVVVGNRGSGVTTSMLLDAAQHGGTSYQVNEWTAIQYGG